MTMTKHKPKAKFNKKALADKTAKLMTTIDAKPDSFEAVISYGHAPMEKIGEIANDLIKVQGLFNQQVTAVGDALTTLETGLKGLELERFGDATLKLLKGLAGGKVDPEDKKLVNGLHGALPKMLDEVTKLVDNLSQTDAGIADTLKQIAKIERARVAATRDIMHHLEASKKIVSKYNEEYIPEAKKAFDDYQDPEYELYLKDVTKRKEDFLDRVIILEATRCSSVIAGQQLRQMTDALEGERMKFQDIVYNSQNEWKSMLSAAGIAVSSAGAGKAAESGAQTSKPKKHSPHKPGHA
jgi:uncharacterized protein YaaN involved in tellurite resistance